MRPYLGEYLLLGKSYVPEEKLIDTQACRLHHLGELILTGNKRIGILWSHNEQTYPGWLLMVTKIIELQGFVWWDVGWNIRANQFTYPAAGYICRRGKITHRALLQSIEISHQPHQDLAKEVAQNFRKFHKLGIYRPPYDQDLAPLNKFLNGEKKILTLLKLIELEELPGPLSLTDLKLWNDEVISRCPQGYYRILLPQT